MIRHFRIGTPIDTESVMVCIPEEETEPEKIQGKLGEVSDGALVSEENKELVFFLKDEDIVYGLGETVRGMNKRGWIYKSNCTDDPYHLEEKNSLYGAHNFLLITSPANSFALYVDTPGLVTFDIGYTKSDELVITLEDFDTELYLITGTSPRDIVQQFRTLIGQSYIPPKWAFGYGQSRWSYMNKEEVREVADGYRKAGIPLDMIYLDIDYMDHYKDFTINEETFSDFPAFVSEMKEKGVRLIPIIDAGVKIEKGYSVYEEGLEKGYFCKKEDGTEMVAAVWPGEVHFPDVLRPEVREWFGNKYKFLMDQGIEGFWNDMNEPAIFYSPDHLNEVFDKLEDYKGKNLDLWASFSLQDMVKGLANNPEDYQRFYHEYHGQTIRHDKVHNLFGFNMTRAAGEAFLRLSPDKPTLMFSRSSCIGMHRYGGVWTGDNRSWWSHILLNIQQMPGLNMCGFLYSGADIGGFSGDATQDLMLRWAAVGIFTPLFRNHSAMGTRRQEFWRFERIEDFKHIVELRYSLIPYLYSAFMRAVKENDMYMAPLLFDYPEDARAACVEDQLLVGESIMIAPVYQQNARGRYVYLPEEMKLLLFRSFEDYDEEVLAAGDHYIRVELNEVPIFVRKGKSLPLAKPACCVDEINDEELVYFSCGEDVKPYEFYAR